MTTTATNFNPSPNKPMSSQIEHTPEPWIAIEGGPLFSPWVIVDGDQFQIANVSNWRERKLNTDKANAIRIVACVNACAGMTDPEKELAALRANPAPDDKLVDALRERHAHYLEGRSQFVQGEDPGYNYYDGRADGIQEAIELLASHSARGDGPGDVDPGEGYRLLKPEELTHRTDEVWNHLSKQWQRTALPSGLPVKQFNTYRRRITSAMQEGGV